MSRKWVVRLMQADELQARPRKRFEAITDSNHVLPVAPNVLTRPFQAEAPNQRWVGDTKELLVGRDAELLDPFSRLVVGWALSAANDRPFVLGPADGD